jgi:hypothetical protein
MASSPWPGLSDEQWESWSTRGTLEPSTSTSTFTTGGGEGFPAISTGTGPTGANFAPNPFPEFGGGGLRPGPDFGFDGGFVGRAGGGAMTPDQFLAYGGGDINFLRQAAADPPLVTALPPWQAMVEAQQRNIDRRFGDLTEAFGASGNRFSTSFGQAATDFQTQAAADQNAMLAQMQFAAMTDQERRGLTAAQQLGQLGYGGVEQLSGQNFNALMNQMQQQFAAGQSLFGAGTSAAAQLASQGMAGAQQLFGASLTGAQGLYGSEIQAAMAETARQMELQKLGLGTAQSFEEMFQANLGLGAGLGGQQYGITQDQINRLMQEYMRTQPQYNPLLPYMFQGATSYPPQYTPTYTPGFWDYFASVAGQVGGAVAGKLTP